MAKLDKPHVVGRVQSEARAREVIELCDRQGWYVAVDVAPNEPEDLSDIERQVNGQPRAATPASAPQAPPERSVLLRQRQQVQEVSRSLKGTRR